MEGETPATESSLLDMMEKAKALASLMQPGDAAAPESGPDMERIMQMMALMRQFGMTAEAPAAEAGLDSADTGAAFDACIQTPALQALKAAIPHMEPSRRHNLSVAVKCMEIRLLHTHYARTDIMAQSGGSPHWRQDMMAAMQPHLPREQRQMLSLFTAMTQMMTVLAEMKQDREGIVI